MKIGFLFPGQGTQSIGMGKDLYEKYEEYRDVYESVKHLTGIPIAELTFDGEEEQLNQTKNTQICILTMSLAILALLKKENIEAIASMGLSLGEYAALIYSGAISFEDGVRIVQKRGKLMQDLCPKGDWSMAAIIGLDDEKVEKICFDVKSGFVAPANYNCIGQIVVSGEKNAVSEVIEKAKIEGAKRAIELKTSGPFHTQMLKEAAIELRKELELITINPFKSVVIKNLDGKEYGEATNVKDTLGAHIISAVQFKEGIKTMLDMGIDTFIEIGPGNTLSGFVKRTSKDVNILNIDSVETLENTIKWLKERKI